MHPALETLRKALDRASAIAIQLMLLIVNDPIFNGLAIALIIGIFVSTLLTRVVIPVLYYAVKGGRFKARNAVIPAAA